MPRLDHQTDLPLAVLTFTDESCDEFVIWSFEHDGWWKLGRMGYTDNSDRAGRYTLAEACQIVGDANRFSRQGLNEIALPVELVWGWGWG